MSSYRLGKRPEDFFGLEDYDGTEPWEDTEVHIQEEQALWDSQYDSLPWWRKILHSLFGIDQGAHTCS